jgi:hypothetical protein
MITPNIAAPGFVLHPAIANKAGDFFLRCNGASLLANPIILVNTAEAVVYEVKHKIGAAWIRIRARFESKNAHVQFWGWAIHGDTDSSSPLFDSQVLAIATGVGDEMFAITLGEDGQQMLHGQGFPVQRWVLDFSTVKIVARSNIPPLEPGRYAPTHPNKTGGNWPYMGYNFASVIGAMPILDLRARLYRLGNYGGYFLRPTGEFLEESDRPELIARSHIHERSTNRGWIHYTDPAAHWRDRLAGGFQNQDKQHLCLWSPLAAAARLHPADEGFQMLLEAGVHVYTRQVPIIEKGTTHHKSGAERAQGRILQSGMDLESALRKGSRLANVAALRADARVEIDEDAGEARLSEGKPRWAQFGSNPGISPAEVGIHYAGLRRIAAYGGGEWDTEDTLRAAARYCFDAFIEWTELPGNRVLDVPYWIHWDGQPWGGPSSTEHFCWLAAINHEPENDIEREKLKRIYDLGEGIDERWRSVP